MPTDPAKPIGEERLLDTLRERMFVGTEDEEFVLTDTEARALLASFLEANAEAMAKVCDAFAAEHFAIAKREGLAGNGYRQERATNRAGAGRALAAALRAVGKGDKR